MKIEIIRKVSITVQGTDCFFHIMKDDSCIGAVSFKLDEPEDSVWNEAANFKKAVDFAKKVMDNKGETDSKTTVMLLESNKV